MENLPPIRITDKKFQELLALQEINLNIVSEEDTSRILASVVERAVNLLEAKGGSVYLLDTDYGLLNNEVCFNLDPDYASISLEVGTGIAGWVAQEGYPQLIGDYKSVTSQVEIHPGNGFGPVAAVPIAWQGQVRGVLELIRSSGSPQFIQEDLGLLQSLANLAATALKSASLLKEANSKANQLTTLNEVNLVISATLDREVALNLVTEKAVEILQTEAGSIFLVDSSGKDLIFEVALGPTGVKLVGARIPIDTNSIAGSIAASRTPLIVNNVADDSRWNTSFDEATEFHTRDILGVPMVAFNKVVGVIEVINKKNGRRFTVEDEEILEIFAGQAAIVLLNAERFTQTDQALTNRVKELNILEIIDRELNATLDLKTVLSLTLSSMMDFLGASVGLIAMLNEEKDGLYFKSILGVAQQYKRYFDTPWPLEQGVIGRVATTGKSVLITNNKQIDNLSSDGRSTSQLCLPIISEDEVTGIISLERAGLGTFTQGDQEFATRLASHAVLAIKNARLFEEVTVANQAKTEFMSVTSHELKIPMTSIKGYAKILGMIGADSLTDQQKDFLKVIINNVDRMDRLVSDLLDVSRIEAGRIRLEIGDVSIKEVIEDVLESVDTQIKAKNLQLKLDIESPLPIVRADYGRMVQIMTNLISNAYKYTPDGGSIEVKANVVNGSKECPLLSIYVKDSGFGISEEDQKQLFKKFFRASDQNIREVPGTGLGLAITKSFIELHGGNMWFESTLGKGSTFGFDLPVSAGV